MSVNIRLVMAVAIVCVGAASAAHAQVNSRDVPLVTQPQQRFDAGQDVQPIFEGWARDDDGSYLFHFGYLNRNYRQSPSLPIGPSNYFSPGGEDRGQPTYFYPRTQRYQFTVSMPAETGSAPEDGVVWHVTANGSEQLAYGWLQPEWEIDVSTITSNGRTGFGRSKDQLFANGAPSVTVSAATTTVRVAEPFTVTASIADDQLPTPLAPRKPRTRLPALVPPDGAPKVPDNVQWYSKPRPPRNGLSVLWTVYRGPAEATIAPADYQRAVAEDEGDDPGGGGRIPGTAPASKESTSIDGDGWTSATFETTVTFETPGTYTLRAWASDAMLIVPADLTITVQ